MNILINVVVPLVVAIFASQGFWAWFSKRGGENKEIIEKIKTLTDKVDRLQQVVDEDKAIEARVRILRFNGELLRDVKHTEEEFTQVLSDIDSYEDYSRNNPDFPNSKAVLAIENVKRCYKKCSEERSFL